MTSALAFAPFGSSREGGTLFTKESRRGGAAKAVRVVQAGPGRDAPGGMTRVAEMIETVADVDGRVRTTWVDSGGGRGWQGYLRFPAAVVTMLLDDYDLLHIHLAERGSIVRKTVLAECSRRRGKPYVVHLHGARSDEDYATLPAPIRGAFHRLLGGAVAVVALGSFWRDWLTDTAGVDEARVLVVPNGVTDLGPRPSSPSAPSALFVGSVDRRKGAASYARVAARLVAAGGAGSDWRYLIVGPTTTPDVAAEIRSLEALTAARVRLVGPLAGEPLREAYREASIFILPSHAEGLPMVVLEAMSAGLAIITTPVGSIPDAITDGENGLLVPPGDDDALAAAITRLIEDRALRVRLGQRARSTWEQHYSAGRSVGMLITLWLSVLDSSAGTSPTELVPESP